MEREIAECLSNTLSPDKNTRVAAELKLGEFLATPEVALVLAEVVVINTDGDPAHASSIALRRYVKERWSPFFQTFKGSAPPPEYKDRIRKTLFRGLSDPVRKVRSSCAHTLSAIANCDWPDEYPDLLSSLIELLSSNSPNAVHGAMQVFKEFIKADLTEDQILPILRQLLPVLLNILGSTETHSPLTRARTIAVFRECVTALYMVKEIHPQATKEAISTILPTWLDAFKVLLSLDFQQELANTENWDALAIRMELFKTLDVIHVSFPRAMTDYFNDFLSASLRHLQIVQQTFNQYYLAASDLPPRTSENDSLDLPALICPIIDFTSAVVRSGKAKTWLDGNNLNALVTAVFNLVQITSDDEENWVNDANAFVAQEEDETLQYSVRIAGFDFLAALLSRSPASTTRAFNSVLQQVLILSQQAREAGEEDWWRTMEAALASIGSVSEVVTETIEDEQDSGRGKPIDIDYLLSQVIPNILGLSQFPFLQGRGFVFASQFASLLPTELASQYLDTSIQVIEAEQPGIPVKLSAVKAIHNFSQNAKDEILINYAARVANDLRPFVTMTSEDTLTLVLETLAQVLELQNGAWVTRELADGMVDSLLEVWRKNNQDPLFCSLINEIFTFLASSKADGVYETVIQKALPPLSQIMGSAGEKDSWIVQGAIDLVASIIEGAPESGIGNGLFAHFAPSLFRCVGELDDRGTTQQALVCLTTIVRKDINQILSWKDESGQGGLDYTFKLIASVLQSKDETGDLAIGDLIIHLLRRAGESVAPVLPELLQAMVTRMLTAKTASFLQSLIIPFAFLINNQRDTVISLLESIDVQGRSGLDILVQTWCENAQTFVGFWAQRISTLGLTQLFIANRPSLQNLIVKGELIITPETRNVIMTRSRAKKIPHQFTQISFALKTLKLIVQEVQSGGDSATITAQDPAGANKDMVMSDDEDEDWAEDDKDEPGSRKDELAYLSELLGPRGLPFDNDDLLDFGDDEDLKKDPVSQMDMQGHLKGFILECASHNTNNFSDLVGRLDAQETLVVRQIIGA